MAALGGHGKAQLILGVTSYQGIGVRKDLVEAHRWFALAQSTLPPGIDRERSIRAISLIRTGMTTEQLSIVQATAPVASTGAE